MTIDARGRRQWIQAGVKGARGTPSEIMPATGAEKLQLPPAFLVPLAGAALLLGSCAREAPLPAPFRVTTPAVLPDTLSSFTVPVSVPLATLQQALERGAPLQLWSIDEQKKDCIPAQRIKLLKKRVKVTPDISCRIVGQVTRGRIILGGTANRLTLGIPIRARISARDVGGVLKGETATASAMIRASLSLSVDRNWGPRSKVSISYDWREPPGIDFLGKRISFVKRADRELAKVLAGMEREVQREIGKFPVRRYVEQGWREGFMVIELSRERPPAWLRVTPRGLGFAGFRVNGRTLQLTLAGIARTETFVGADRPAFPQKTALPPPIKAPGGRLKFVAPVLADYRELEPVILRALRKLNSKGIAIDQVGRVEALFDKVTVYQTEGGRLAVGVEVRVRRLDARVSALDLKSKGTVWLTGIPFNEPNSKLLKVRDLKIFGNTDNQATNLLLRLADSPDLRQTIAGALTQDLAKDYDKVITAARKAIADKPLGDFRLRAQIDDVRHGEIKVNGDGLLIPVFATGSAQVTLSK